MHRNNYVLVEDQKITTYNKKKNSMLNFKHKLNKHVFGVIKKWKHLRKHWNETDHEKDIIPVYFSLNFEDVEKDEYHGLPGTMNSDFEMESKWV